MSYIPTANCEFGLMKVSAWPKGCNHIKSQHVMVLVLAIALLTRFWHITTWSLWEDEEWSIAQAFQPDNEFRGFFPIFFAVLNPILAASDLSVGAARLLPALMGILSIGLTYYCFRRWVTAPVALMAALLLAINIGHVFWSQSVRYYTAVLVFQMLTVFWFYDGFENDRTMSLVLANIAFVLALLTHFSAMLLAPVLVGYLMLVILHRIAPNGLNRTNVAVFGVLFGSTLIVFLWRMVHLRNLIGGYVVPSMRDPAHVGVTLMAYFGIPILAIGCLSPWLASSLSSRTRLLFYCIAGIPLLELLVIVCLNLINVTWYYAFIAMFGWAVLSASVFVGLWQRQKKTWAISLCAISIAYYLTFLGGYHFNWNGDRPRWKDAADYLRMNSSVAQSSPKWSEVYGQSYGVLSFYLGADPRSPSMHPIVQKLPAQPPSAPVSDSWYVVEARAVPGEYKEWFSKNCTLRARFDSFTGPIDRSVLIYQCTPKPVVASPF